MAGARIQLKRATASSWSSANPVLYAGEIGYETDTNKFKIGNGSTAYNSLPYFNGNLTGSNLNDLADVTIVSASNGDFLRWNGTAWINDAVNLSTDTVGNYMVDVAGGTGVTITHTPGEGSTASVAIGQDVATSASVTFAHVSAPISGNLTGNVTGNVTGDVSGNAGTATALQNSRTISLGGDLSGSVSFNGTSDVTINASVQPNSVALGTDTTGNYMTNVVGGTGVTVSHTPEEGSTASVSIGQEVATSSSVTFAAVTAPLIGNANTASTLQTARTIQLIGDLSGSASFDGSTSIQISASIEPNSVALGQDTTGDYMQDIVGGTGVTVVHTPGESSTASVSIGQDVSTSASVTFANLTVSGDLTVNGTTTTLNTQNLLVEDNTIVLNANVTGDPSGTAGIEIERGSLTNVELRWNETTDSWEITEDGTTYRNIATGQDVETSSSVTFAAVTAPLVGNASTATALQNARTIELSGDVSGSASFDGTSNINISTTVNTASVSITELGGVSISSPEEFQGLSYNGTSWVNSHIPLASYVQNAETTTLATGTVVYLFGGTGDHASVKRADNNSDTTSSKTIGVIGANIAASQSGPVITRGYVDGIDLSVGYSVGDVLWLGENGQFTTTKPSAPDHLVFVGVVVRATNNGIIYVATQNGYELEELHDVKISGLADGDFLKYNSASAVWVNDPINLGTDTVGNYVQNLVAGTGVTLSNNSGEGSTPTVAIGQDVATSASVVFHTIESTHDLTIGGNLYVSGSVVTENQTSLAIDDPFIYLNVSSSVSNVDLGVAGNYNDGTYRHAGVFRDATDGKFKFFDSYEPEPSSPIDVAHATYSPAPVVAETFESTIATGSAPFVVSSTTEVANLHADTATTLHTARTISLGGDLSGSASFDGSGDITITASVEPNSIALGTDTTGNYMAGLTEGTGVTITHTPGEGSNATIAIGQAVGTSSSVTFAAVTAPLIGNASTATTLETSRTIELTGDVTGSASFNGSANASITATIAANSVALGTDTTGNYVSDVTAGTGVTVTHTPGEGSSPTVAIGQAVGTSASVQFAQINTTGNVTIGGDLTVNGTTTTINTETINLADNIIVLNSNETSTPSQNAGIEVERGSSTNVALRWNEANDKWELTTDGSNYDNIATEDYAASLTPSSLDDIGDVTLTSASAGDFLKWNGSAWVNDPINLGTDTVGNYVSDVVAGNLITVTHTPGEGSSASVAVTNGTAGQIIVANASGVATWVTESGDITVDSSGVTAISSGVIVNADISTSAAIAHSKLANASEGQVLLGTTTTGVVTATTVSGDVTITGAGVTAIGSGVIVNADINSSAAIALSKLASGTSAQVIVANSSGVPTYTTLSGDVTISDTGVVSIAANSVALGTDTTGNYVSNVSGGTGITVTHTPGEGSSASVALNATLDDLSNVTAPSPSDGQFLKYVSASAAWVPAAIPTINALDDIGDVSAPSPTTGEVLAWNGTAWADSTVVRDNLVRFYMEVI